MENILGQSRAIDILQAGLQTGRLHHAYIFHGPRGVGKFTAAREFARTLLCHDPQRDLAGRVSACGSCASCKAMIAPPPPPKPEGKRAASKRKSSDDDESEEEESETPITEADAFDREPHPDYHVIRKELAAMSSIAELRKRKQMNIPVDLLRELMIGGKTMDGAYHDSIAFKSPRMNHNKVFIIDEAELLDSAGQNSMLKTLEEPSPGTFIILVTSSEDRLLSTIRSRCQRVAFTALPESVVSGWVAKHAAGITDHHAQWLTRFAAGSLGRVELAVKYELYEWAKSVLPLVNAMRDGRYPAPLGAIMSDLMKAFAERWVDEHRGASKDAANKQAAGLMWTLITQHARHKMVELSARCQANNPIATEAALEPWLGVIDAIGGAERDLASNVNMSLVCDALVAAMHRSLAPVAV